MIRVIWFGGHVEVAYIVGGHGPMLTRRPGSFVSPRLLWAS